MEKFLAWLKQESNEHLPALWEAVKEPLRLIVLAVVPYAITRLAGINAEWAVIATLVLRAIDRYMHEKAPDGVSGGLTRF